MKQVIKDTVILLIITLAAGLVLGFVYQITKEPIAKQQEKAKMEACKEVFQEASTFAKADWNALPPERDILTGAGYEEEKIDEVMLALDQNDSVLGYVLTVTTSEGYGGDITFTMGVSVDGTLNGISILKISETPGLGMKAEEILKPQFTQKKVESFEYTKSGAMADNQIDAISGATITTNAFTNGVNAGLIYCSAIMEGGQSHE